jgi:hypothetical protein
VTHGLVTQRHVGVSDDVSGFRSQPLPRPAKPLVADAVARVYIRRNADPAAIERIKQHLKGVARGEYRFGQRGAWTTIDVATVEDLLLIRTGFQRLIDGWQELP